MCLFFSCGILIAQYSCYNFISYHHPACDHRKDEKDDMITTDYCVVLSSVLLPLSSIDRIELIFVCLRSIFNPKLSLTNRTVFQKFDFTCTCFVAIYVGINVISWRLSTPDRGTFLRSTNTISLRPRV